MKYPPCRVDEELERSEGPISQLSSHATGRIEDLATNRFGQRRARGHLDDLLMTALQSAFAFTDVDDLHPVAHDLDFDVAGADHQLLQIQGSVAKRPEGFRSAAFVCLGKFVTAGHGAHAPPAAPRHGLDHRRAVLVEEGVRRVEIGVARRSGERHHLASAGEQPPGGLVAQFIERLGRRTDERDSHGIAGPGEVGSLAEQAIAGMQGVATRIDRRGDDLLDPQICRRARAGQRYRRIRPPRMQGTGVVLGEHRDGLDPEGGGGASDPDGDLAPVGNEQTANGHRCIPSQRTQGGDIGRNGLGPRCGQSFCATRLLR